jgi:hypothetical protein
VYYGDASRLELLQAAGARRARLLVIALGSPEATLRVAREARREFPQLTVLARAFGWDDAHDLLAAGVDHVYRESLDASLRMGADALHLTGMRAHAARRAAQRFLRHDEESLRTLTAERADRSRYLGAARRRIEELERLLLADRDRRDDDGRDSGWDAESLREEVRRGGMAPPAARRRGRPHQQLWRTRPRCPGSTAHGPTQRIDDAMNNVKVFVLLAGLTALLVGLGGAVGGSTGMLVMAGVSVLLNVGMYWSSSTMVLRAYGARVVTEAEAPGLYRVVDRLRQRAGLPMPTVAIAPQAQPNAFATGRDPAHAVVCVTEGLLGVMGGEELEA